MDAPRRVTLRCGHANLCKPCFARLGLSPRCPTCRAPAVLTETSPRPLPCGTRTRATSARVLSAHSASSSFPRILEAEVNASTLELHAPISGPVAGGPRLILLMGSRGVPLAMLAKRLAAEAAASEALAVASATGSGEDVRPRLRRLRFAFTFNEDGNGDSFSEAVQKVRTCSPHLIVLCAHPDHPSTFADLVKMDIALCAKFGRSAPRCWALVRSTLECRPLHGTCVDALDVQNALHYLGLGPAHVRDTFLVTLGKNTKDIRKLHRALHNSVFRKYLAVEAASDQSAARQRAVPLLALVSNCYLGFRL